MAIHAQVLLDEVKGEGTSIVSSSSSLPLPLLCTLTARASVPLDKNRLAFRHFFSLTREIRHRAPPAIWDGERPRAGVECLVTISHLLPSQKLEPPLPLLPSSPFRELESPQEKKKKRKNFASSS